ncbi:MAG: alpha/beta fold hydrolase [Parcubacteria group bacterium]|nr:alpha/beta fold hydrolase [Parcubacteria group bacterium]
MALAGALVLSWLVGAGGVSKVASSVALLPEPTPEINPVSLPAYAAKLYDGRELKLGPVLAKNEFYTRYFITYQSGDLTISGIMNLPHGAGPFPVLILNHGYIDTAVYTNGRGLKREQDYLARRGYAVLHSDYRNHAFSSKDPEADMKFRLGYVEDVINAVYAVKNSNMASLNKEKIGMLGHSMGGGIAINVLVTQPDLVKAAVLLAPVSADWKDNFEKWGDNRAELTQKLIAVYGEPETNLEFWNNISAINFLDKIASPVMIHHGDRDEAVPITWSDKLAARLKENQKDVTYYTYAGEPHEFALAWNTVMQRTADFFDLYLK